MSRWEISQPVKGKQEWTYYVYNVFLLYVYTYIIITLFTKLTTEFIIALISVITLNLQLLLVSSIRKK